MPGLVIEGSCFLHRWEFEQESSLKTSLKTVEQERPQLEEEGHRLCSSVSRWSPGASGLWLSGWLPHRVLV